MRSGLHLIGKRTTVFDGFELERIDVGEAELRVRHGGSGSPLLLLHGHQRTHATWHRVAPLLARDHSVVCPDLRGYGPPSKPATTPDHEPYSKRAMARDCVALMRALGHDRSRSPATIAAAMSRFASRSTVRTLRHLVVMDGVPIGEALARADAHFAAAWWHWFFLGQTAKPAERVICADPDAWYDIDPVQMGEEAYAELRHALHDPETVHAMCEDYRAGLGIDRDHDAADRREGRRARARLSLSGRSATTWRTCTATPSRSGANGSPTSATASRSTADTTSQRKPRTSLPMRSGCSSRPLDRQRIQQRCVDEACVYLDGRGPPTFDLAPA
jgi:haloacetate dehalogenase